MIYYSMSNTGWSGVNGEGQSWSNEICKKKETRVTTKIAKFQDARSEVTRHVFHVQNWLEVMESQNGIFKHKDSILWHIYATGFQHN